MSSTLLYRAFGFRNYTCLRTTTQDGVITLQLEQYPKRDRCSNCPSRPAPPRRRKLSPNPANPLRNEGGANIFWQ